MDGMKLIKLIRDVEKIVPGATLSFNVRLDSRIWVEISFRDKDRNPVAVATITDEFFSDMILDSIIRKAEEAKDFYL